MAPIKPAATSEAIAALDFGVILHRFLKPSGLAVVCTAAFVGVDEWTRTYTNASV